MSTHDRTLVLAALLPLLACGSQATHPDAPGPTGPGAVLRCESSGKNAFDTYGLPAFIAVNKAVFANVGAELSAHGATNLGDSFGHIGDASVPATADDAPTFEGKVAAFLVFAFGGPTSITYSDGKTYTGPQDMTAAHTGLHITPEQFDYFIAHVVVPALVGSGVKHGAGGASDPDDLSSCFAPVVTDPGFKASIVGH